MRMYFEGKDSTRANNRMDFQTTSVLWSFDERTNDFSENAYSPDDLENAYYGHWNMTFNEHGMLTIEVLNPLVQGADRVVYTRKLKIVLKAGTSAFNVNFPVNNSVKLGMCLPEFGIQFSEHLNRPFIGTVSVKFYSEDLDFIFQAHQPGDGNVRRPENDRVLGDAGLQFEVDATDKSTLNFCDNTWRVQPKSRVWYLRNEEDIRNGYRLAKVAVAVDEIETSQSAPGGISASCRIGKAQYIEIKVEAGHPHSLRVKTDEQIEVVNSEKLPQCFIEVLDAWGHRCVLLRPSFRLLQADTL